MHFEQVRSRLKRYDSINKFNNTTLRNSLINQARLHEGEGAVRELNKEFSSINNNIPSDDYRRGWDRIFNKGSESSLNSESSG